MLKSTVCLSRQIKCDGRTHRYGVTLSGEVPHPPDDAEAVLDKVSELFSLAEEALAAEIERDQGRQTAPKDVPTQPSSTPARNQRAEPLPMNRPASANGTAPSPNPATPKQLQFLRNLGKRKGLSRDDLDGLVAQVLGVSKLLGDLTKREAGQVIDHLTSLHPEESR